MTDDIQKDQAATSTPVDAPKEAAPAAGAPHGRRRIKTSLLRGKGYGDENEK
jgi:hypothetical protein